MRGFFDLHCHWIAGIDDGVRSPGDGVALLRALKQAGFDDVVATPHMRPGMFDNDRAAIERAFAAMDGPLGAAPSASMPRVHLGSEHFLDDVVFGRLLAGHGLAYPSLGAGCTRRPVLIELAPAAFPPRLEHRLFDLARAGLRPVIAHPERYQPVWRDDRCLDPLLDAGACLLLDVCAIVGKYGRAARKAAEKLLDEDAYEAACTDAHRVEDAETVAEAIEALERAVGGDEALRLLSRGPRALLGAP